MTPSDPPTSLQLICLTTAPASSAPYRLVDAQAHDVAWVNDFLDFQHIRGLSSRSIRAYAFDLLHFARWWAHLTDASLSELSDSVLLDYVRYQLEQDPKPAPQTVNHRLTVLRNLYRFHFQCDLPAQTRSLRQPYNTHDPLGYGRTRKRLANLRLKEPRRIMIPLSSEEVAQFWQSFRTFRDLSLIALLLLDGLRAGELLSVLLEDLSLAEAQIRISGKGNRQRVLPLPPDAIRALEKYLHLERPLSNSPNLFVSLKGRRRGQPMTYAGLRSLFRHHRKCSKVTRANPHRFRHTFGADMVRAGISLPALMRLMGHTHIHTTMLYVQLSPQDIWREYARAVEMRDGLPPKG